MQVNKQDLRNAIIYLLRDFKRDKLPYIYFDFIKHYLLIQTFFRDYFKDPKNKASLDHDIHDVLDPLVDKRKLYRTYIVRSPFNKHEIVGFGAKSNIPKYIYFSDAHRDHKIKIDVNNPKQVKEMYFFAK